MRPLTSLVTVRPAQRFLRNLRMQWSRKKQKQRAAKEGNPNSKHTRSIRNVVHFNANANPARAAGSDQAQSPSHDTAAAPATQPAQNPPTSARVFCSRSFAPGIGGGSLLASVSSSESTPLVRLPVITVSKAHQARRDAREQTGTPSLKQRSWQRQPPSIRFDSPPDFC